jgi:hypothetical protein
MQKKKKKKNGIKTQKDRKEERTEIRIDYGTEDKDDE